MMDYQLPPSHYEYCVEVAQVQRAQKVKQEAFRSMNELEGWCTQVKASILIDLVSLFSPKKIVEIGVFGGKSLIPMAFALRENGQEGKIYGIDPWSIQESVQGMDAVNTEWWGGVDHEYILAGLKEKITKFGLDNYVTLIRGSSKDVFLIRDIDILHVDGNHSEEAAIFDVCKWMSLVRRGGFIIFDDVGAYETEKAVALLDKHCIRLAVYKDTTNSWGIWIKP